MNIKERKQLIGIHNQLMSFGNMNKDENAEFINANMYWDRLIKPPIYNYLPNEILQKLNEYTCNKRLYNKPRERFRLINELLAPYGLRPLAPGTNRRTFYCEYDPTIVFKIAYDSVGRSDNLNEFIMQRLLKPFFAKMFHVTPDGLISLSERVETMTEDDYKITWSEYIFQIINDLLSRGYIMEDIGSNFFKNWGIRIGHGPVLLDCPYIYKVNVKKLICTRKDPITKKICNGRIDYNYDKGMSEISCTKCGTRYYASELAEKYPSEGVARIVKGRVYEMEPLDNNFRVKIVREGNDNEVVNRYFIETPAQEISTNISPFNINTDTMRRDVINNNNIQTPPGIIQTNIKSVVTNVHSNYPSNINGYNIGDYDSSKYLFGFNFPTTLLDTLKTNCNIDIEKMTDDGLYTYLTKNITQDYLINRLSKDEYQLFNTFTNQFINNYIESKLTNENILSIFNSYIPQSIVTKINNALKLHPKIEQFTDISLLYNQLATPTNDFLINKALNKEEYKAYQDFLVLLIANNLNSINIIDAKSINPDLYNLKYLCKVIITSSLYYKLENICNLDFKSIKNNFDLAAELIEHKDEIITELDKDEIYQFKCFIAKVTLLLTTGQLGVSTNYPQYNRQDSSKDIVSNKYVIGNEENKEETINQEKSVDNSNNSLTDSEKDKILSEKEAKILMEYMQDEDPSLPINVEKENAKVPTTYNSHNIDSNGNTIGRLYEWEPYYRDNVRYILYPKDIKNDIILLLRKIESTFGYSASSFIARKLEIKYIKSKDFVKDRTQSSISVIGEITTKTETNRSVETNINNNKQQKEINITSSDTSNNDKTSNKYIIPDSIEKTEEVKTTINPEEEWKTRDSEPNIGPKVNIDPNQKYFIEKPKTKEEIEKEEEERLKNSEYLTGIIGETKVDTLRNKTLVPALKEKVNEKFKSVQIGLDISKQLNDLSKEIRWFIDKDVKEITRDDGYGVKVNIDLDVDERNKKCLRVRIENYGSMIFDTVLYPQFSKGDDDDNTITRREYLEQQNQVEEEEEIEQPDFNVKAFISDDEKLSQFFTEKTIEYDLSTLTSVEEAKEILTGFLYSKLIDKVKGHINPQYAMSLAKNYVDQCNITMNNEYVEKENNDNNIQESTLEKEEKNNTIADQI